jgi:hypothetical protein
VFAAVFLCAACGNNNNTTTAPTVATTTDTLTGTVVVGGADSHNVTVNNEGEIDVTLTSAGPPEGIIVALALGIPSSTGCVPISGASKNTAAGYSPQIVGTVTASVLCVQVADIGNQTAPITYSVNVTHP